jgi:hypothetical protein
MRTLLIRAGLLGIVLAGAATPARADATLFVGMDTEAASRPALGVAVGRCPGMFGFELEYAGTLGHPTEGKPSVRTVTANLLVQTTLPIHWTQFYGIAGFGVYGETIGNGKGSGEIASGDIGVGAKITLAGPLKLRLDYRVFLLGASRRGRKRYPW